MLLLNRTSKHTATIIRAVCVLPLACFISPSFGHAQSIDRAPFGNNADLEDLSANLLQDGQLGAELDEEGVEYLTRGQLHEAFADPYAPDPTPPPIIAAAPPEPIQELPPDFRPDGDSVSWIPGYWAWDDERTDFVWISGLWRDIPPGQRWLPGYWEQVDENSFRWIDGMWVANEIDQVTYLPAPPESLEVGPSAPAPRDDAFYVPGNWIYQTQGYQWTPGYWTQTQPDWIWVPATYVWTPRGCIYRSGFWDYEIAQRAVMFTPVYFQTHIYTRPRFAYRPRYVVNTGMNLLVHLFVRNNSRHYYFGDYYGNNYRQNYYPWVNSAQFGRGFDPLYTYFSRSSYYRNQNYFSSIQQQHQFFAQNSFSRPRHTIADQRVFIASNLADSSRLNANQLRHSVIGQPLDSFVRQSNFSQQNNPSGRQGNMSRQGYSSRQFSRLTETQIDQIGRDAETPVREMITRRREFETASSGILGNEGRGGDNRGNGRDRDSDNRGQRSRAGNLGDAANDLINTDQPERRSRDRLDSLQLPDVPSLRDSARRGASTDSQGQPRTSSRPNVDPNSSDLTRRRRPDVENPNETSDPIRSDSQPERAREPNTGAARAERRDSRAERPDSRAERPDSPTLRADSPTLRPDSDVRPGSPAVRPELPAVRPDSPAGRRGSPAVLPETPAVRPESPAVRPASPERELRLREPQLSEFRARERERLSAAARESQSPRPTNPSINPALRDGATGNGPTIRDRSIDPTRSAPRGTPGAGIPGRSIPGRSILDGSAIPRPQVRSDLNRIQPTAPVPPNVRGSQTPQRGVSPNPLANPRNAVERQDSRSRPNTPFPGSGANNTGRGIGSPARDPGRPQQPRVNPPTSRGGGIDIGGANIGRSGGRGVAPQGANPGISSPRGGAGIGTPPTTPGRSLPEGAGNRGGAGNREAAGRSGAGNRGGGRGDSEEGGRRRGN